MVQFKPFFLGQVEPDYPCATSVQKCLRTTDINNVGRTARHLTFFEMLGNFSFGDYYKERAIPLAWEFLTSPDWIGLDKSRFWITVYTDDDEAIEIWKNTGVPVERIIRLGEDTNFWSAGPTGPCGPCSELHYDLGDRGIGEHDCGLECECGRYLEVWNLVFMQYDRDEGGILNPLEKRGIDTGMGLERLVSILQDKPTNFETDLLHGILSLVSQISRVEYKNDPDDDISLRIIADHARAVTFMVADGILPSNEGRGYVLRRLLRRSVRHGRRLGIDRPFLVELADLIVKTMGDAYHELGANHEHIRSVLSAEENRFTDTLRQGMAILSSTIDEAKEEGSSRIDGDIAFQLHDTFGFPLELTMEIAEEQGLSIDTGRFEQLMEEQRSRSSSDVFYGGQDGLSELYLELRQAVGGAAEFIGYSDTESEADLSGIIAGDVRVTEAHEGADVSLLFSPTPFYAESGGQVGDSGSVETETGRVNIEETISPVDGLILHKGKVVQGFIKVGQEARAFVDKQKRYATMRNHTATHILQWALRAVLGEHVRQAGSLVSPDRLRFDFTHTRATAKDELRRVERLVNDRIISNQQVRAYVTSIDYAREIGATALFGEKYGQYVRVIETGDFSKELCGGTHAHATGDIGLFKIVSESSVGANIRRIEALTGSGAYEYSLGREDILAALSERLSATPEDLAARVESILESTKDLERQVAKVQSAQRHTDVDDLLGRAEQFDSVSAIISEVPAQDFDALRAYVDLLRNRQKSGVFILAASAGDKALLVASVTPDLMPLGLHAGNIVKEIAPVVGGGGGGRPELAQAGGKDASKLSSALDKARDHLRRVLAE